MKIIEVAAPLVSKGSRILVKFDEDRWKIGTITTVAAETLYITYDDGVKEKRDSKDPALARTRFALIRPKVLNDRMAESMKYAFINPPKVSADKGALPTYPGKLEDDDASRMDYMVKFWTFLNRVKFNSAMKIPRIDYLKDQEASSMRTLGQWEARKRRLAVSRRLFNAPESDFYETFLHEMCHQAVSEINKIVDRSEGGHGAPWVAWMLKVGLDPRRYNTSGRENFLSDDEKYDRGVSAPPASLPSKRPSGSKEPRSSVPLNNPAPGIKLTDAQLKPLLPGSFQDKAGQWHEGVIVCKENASGTRWVFVKLSDPAPNSFNIIPRSMLHSLTDATLQKLTRADRDLLTKIDRIHKHFAAKGL